MKARPVKKDSAHDNTGAGIERRAVYAERAIHLEAQIVAGDVGAVMAVCALLGVAERIALEHGMPKRAFEGALIDMLQKLNRDGGP